MINVSVDTIRRWISTLEQMYYCFIVRPWYKNIPKTLRKQPKIYLWDWSAIKDKGSRNENFVASHLLKAVHFWTDYGYGTYNLYYLRDKSKRKVDFLVTKDESPWFLVEVKSSAKRQLNQNLDYFGHLLGISEIFQIDFDSPYVEIDCFSARRSIQVPASTFLSQLV